jgi:hypothetical protein
LGKRKEGEKEMKNNMNKNVKIWLIPATLVVVALLATFWATAYVSPASPWEFRHSYEVRGDIELYYIAKTVISTINGALLIFLLVIYINIYRKTKSEFTVGLIIFSIILLLHALVSNPLIHGSFGFHGYGLGPFAMLPDLFTCAALIVLLYLSFKY